MNNLQSDRPIALYVHIPFCETKCPYCDFNTYAGIETLMPAYVEALLREIELWREVIGPISIGTVFFGGGTPSYLPAGDLENLMRAIGDVFGLLPDIEVTLEANPGDLDESNLLTFLEAGVNRLSIGVQTLDNRHLKTLGRRHNARQAKEAVCAARRAGFTNLSIDLMYGLPYQNMEDWRATLAQGLELHPEHVSMYCLTLESGTPMQQQVEVGQIVEPDPDLAADMYECAESSMEMNGYHHYEISNWAQPGRESRHNLTYWLNHPYLGVGPGAHSFLAGCRFGNLKSPREYIRRLTDYEVPEGSNGQDSVVIAGVPVVENVDVINRETEMAETMMLGLRLDAGVSNEVFANRFGRTPHDVYPDVLDDLTEIGLLDISDGAIRLTARGRLLGNEVFGRFIVSG